jgi:hypothetical protein
MYSENLKKIDTNTINLELGEIALFTRIKDEALRLPFFLEYYRKLGVNRFFIVDNDSADSSKTYLLSQKDVHVFYTAQSYKNAKGGRDWVNELLSSHSVGRWALTVDADELFVFPGCEKSSLKVLTQFLEKERKNGMPAILIDMYGAGPIKDIRYIPGEDFLDYCPFFDGEEYTPDFRGGARQRLFWTGETITESTSPCLSKVPLVKWDENCYYKSGTHQIDGLTLSYISGGLLHFQLFSDFQEKVNEAVKLKQYWNNSSEYSVYQDALLKNPDLTAFHKDAVKYHDSKQLCKMGFHTDSKKFRLFRIISHIKKIFTSPLFWTRAVLLSRNSGPTPMC